MLIVPQQHVCEGFHEIEQLTHIVREAATASGDAGFVKVRKTLSHSGAHAIVYEVWVKRRATPQQVPP